MRRSHNFQSVQLVIVGMLVALLFGVTVSHSPLLLLPMMAAAGGLFVLALGGRTTDLFLASIGVLLLGYALLDRGFAYVGIPPVFVSEVVLALALFALLSGRRPNRPIDTLQVLLVLFMCWGAARAIPFIASYGLHALRDSVVWIYCLFALVIALSMTKENVYQAVRLYRAWLVPFLLIAPLSIITTRLLGDSLPTWPISDVPMVSYKGGDLAVHLTGVAAFLLLGLPGALQSGQSKGVGHLWFLWLPAIAIPLTGRGALLTSSIGVAVAVLLSAALQSNAVADESGMRRHSRHQLLPRIMPPLLIGSLLFAVLLPLQPSIDMGARSISLDQFLENARSIFIQDDSIAQGLRGTTEWRLSWWDMIIDYTFNGPYFWAGKGFGINLASVDGFQVLADESLRSPHSIHFTILARMGVPGLMLWVVLQLYFGIALIRAFLRMRSRKQLYWAQINAWIFAYWVSFLVNASFDVYIEGPQGGIWFWAVFGFGMAALRLQGLDSCTETVGRTRFAHAHSTNS